MRSHPQGPYVAELYSSFEDPGCVYLVMEYCEGGDLFKTMLMHGGVLEEQWVCVEVWRHVRLWAYCMCRPCWVGVRSPP